MFACGGDRGFPMMTSSSVYVLFIDDGGYLARPVAKAPYDGGQRNQVIGRVECSLRKQPIPSEGTSALHEVTSIYIGKLPRFPRNFAPNFHVCRTGSMCVHSDLTSIGNK
jgi:hypothetical protein